MEHAVEFFSCLGDAIWSFDIKSQSFLYTNGRLEEILGVPLHELEEGPLIWKKLVHPDDYQRVKREMERVYAGESVESSYRILVQGRTRWILDKKSAVLAESAKIWGISGVLSDITDIKESQMALLESEQAYRSLFDDNPIPQWIYDRETLQFLAVNQAAIERYGYSEEEFLSMTIADIRPSEDLPRLVSRLKKVRNPRSRSEGWRHVKKDGGVLHVNVSGFSILYKGRRAEIVTVEDVTSEVRSRREVALSKKNTDALINNIRDLIWSVDRNFCLISANASFLQMVKNAYGTQLLPGESVLGVNESGAHVDKWRGYYQRALGGENVVFMSVSSLGAVDTFEIRMHPIHDDQDVVGVACVGQNIQKKIEAEKRMILQNIELKEIVSLASHEIRGPVTSLMGLMNLLNKSNLADPFNKEVISHIELAIKELDSVIHKIVNKSYAIQRENEAIYSSPQNLSDYE